MLEHPIDMVNIFAGTCMRRPYNLGQVEIVQVKAPCPDAYKSSQALMTSYCKNGGIPNTTMIATRYGKGRVRLNASSCGSSPGSRSMLRRGSHDFEIGGFRRLAWGTTSD
jgi:hypothetical protein